jgi:FMN-dependent NADH-azoreductase
MRILHVIGSLNAEDSTSPRVAVAFLEAYQRAHPDHAWATLDVWTEDLPCGLKHYIDLLVQPGFMGLHDVRAIIVEGTTLPQSARQKLVEGFCETAPAAAINF